MSIYEALILGIVQGITEFLPVSSSGHLVLLQKVFGIEEPALLFDTAVHGGTLVAVFVVLWRDILNILRRIFQPLTLYLIIATVPAAIAALLFRHQIEDFFSSGIFLGFAFLITSCLLLFSEMIYRRRGNYLLTESKYRRGASAGPENNNGNLPAAETEVKKARLSDEMTWFDALFIGLFQAVAVIPGISRSGATISAALSRRLDRDFAARFSFLLSIPTILGAIVLQAKNLTATADAGAGGIGLAPIAAGTISAAIVAFFSIRLALKIVREHSLRGFALYTGILGLLVLIDRLGTHFFF